MAILRQRVNETMIREGEGKSDRYMGSHTRAGRVPMKKYDRQCYLEIRGDKPLKKNGHKLSFFYLLHLSSYRSLNNTHR